MEKTKIEWTGTPLESGEIEPGFTFNGWIGCSKVSQGCKNCYAEREMDHRYGRAKWGDHGTRSVTKPAYWRKPLQWDREAKERGIRLKVFGFSLADWLEDREELIHPRALLLELIKATPNLDWLLLSKRVEEWERRMMELCDHNLEMAAMIAYEWLDGRPLPNVWMGTSAEDQPTADQRFPALVEIPAVLHFVSLEPLLAPVDFTIYREVAGFEVLYDTLNGNLGMNGQVNAPMPSIDWVIMGGESGPNARPTPINAFRAVRDQAVAAGVPLFMKQWGEWISGDVVEDRQFSGGSKLLCSGYGAVGVSSANYRAMGDGTGAARVGKRNSGYLLDGAEWRQFPAVNPAKLQPYQPPKSEG